MTWLQSVPRIKFKSEKGRRKPHPLKWEEQDRVFYYLPKHLRLMVVSEVNTGCREAEVCNLRWEWERPYSGLRTSVFVVPGELVKNGDDRVIVLDRAAFSVIEQVRGDHPEFVFTRRGEPVGKMYNSAWKRARRLAGLSQVRVHDLKHTYGRRLRAAEVTEEDRKACWGTGMGEASQPVIHWLRSQNSLPTRIGFVKMRNTNLTQWYFWKRKSGGRSVPTSRIFYRSMVELDGIEPTTS
jgi:integrase